MEPSGPLESSNFSHTPVKTEARLLIVSTCRKCGASKLVSQFDGSLKQWEDGHECRNADS
jgi:hypothetical protein